jgi:hypothetical protein
MSTKTSAPGDLEYFVGTLHWTQVLAIRRIQITTIARQMKAVCEQKAQLEEISGTATDPSTQWGQW